MPEAAAYGSFSTTTVTAGISIPPGTETSYSAYNLTYPYVGQLWTLSLYARLPRYANVTSAYWTLTGYPTTEFDSNLTDVSVNGTWTYASANLYDGSWSTYGQCSNGNICYAMINYTKETGATNAYWEIAGNVESPAVHQSFRENISLADNHASCWSQDVLQFMVVSDSEFVGGDQYQNEWYCWDGSSWDLVQEKEAGSNTAAAVYEEAITWFYYPTNITIDTADDGSLDYENDTSFTTSETIDLNVTAMNYYLHEVCTSDWDGNCYVEIEVDDSAHVPGILAVTDIEFNGTYLDLMNNCTGDSSYTNTLNFTFLNEVGYSSVNGSAEFAVYFEDFTYNSSVTNVTQFGLCTLGDSDYTVNMTMLYRGSGFDQRTYYFYQAELDGSANENVNLYQISSSLGEKVEVNTRDSNDNDVEDVYVNIDRYYPETDSYSTVAIGKSGNTGEFLTYLDLDDVFYRFTLSQAGTVVNSYSAMTITDTADDPETMVLYIGALETQFFEMIEDIGVSCYFNETSNNTVCSITDPSGLVVNATLYLQEIGLAGVTTICTDSDSGASFTLTCNITNPSGEYKYFIQIEPTANPDYVIYTDYIFTATTNPYGAIGLFVGWLLILAMAGVGIYVHEIVGVVLGASMAALVISGLISLPWASVTSIIIMGILLLIGARRTR